MGYIEKDFIAEQNNDAVATFGFVGGEEFDGNLVLGDITANDDFSIANGDSLSVYVAGMEQFTASYFSRDLLDSIGYEDTAEGWWDVEAAGDMDMLLDPQYCYNNYSLPFGTGFTVSPASSDAKLIFKGEVRGEVEVTYVGEQNNDSGAAVPVDCKLGDFKGNDYFSIANGDSLSVYIGGMEQFTASYFSRDLLDSIGYEDTAEGWWDVEAAGDMDMLLDPQYCYNNYALAAGQGFTVSPASDDAGLIFPDPQTLNNKN